MLKNLSQIEIVINEKVCRFMCEMDTPIEVVKEALFQFQIYVGKVEENVKAQQAEKESKDDSKQLNNEGSIELDSV